MIRKPMLADDADLNNIMFPVIAQPKIDGVRGINTDGILTGRSFKKHANIDTTNRWSTMLLSGFDGEMYVGGDQTADDLCSTTSSALSTKEGVFNIGWTVFDYVDKQTYDFGYQKRLEKGSEKLHDLKCKFRDSGVAVIDRTNIIESVYCQNMSKLLELEEMWLSLGYEGVCFRNPKGLYKQGRSTVREGGLLRIKRFIEDDAVVLALVEGETNNNVSQVNELGQTFRSTHKANKVKNNMIGSLSCRLTRDVICPRTLSVIFKKGMEITVAPGAMTHKDRMRYWASPELIVGKTIKFNFFPKGIKDKPRFPNFQSFRIESDKT